MYKLLIFNFIFIFTILLLAVKINAQPIVFTTSLIEPCSISPSIIINITSGQGPFTTTALSPTNISTPVTTDTITNLNRNGNYTITVKDVNNITKTASIWVPDTFSIKIDGLTNFSSMDDYNRVTSCPGASDGLLSLQIITGNYAPWQTGNYSATIFDGVNTTINDTNIAYFNGPAGSYTMTVTNDYGCTAAANETIIDPEPLLLYPKSIYYLKCQGNTANIIMNITGWENANTIAYPFPKVSLSDTNAYPAGFENRDGVSGYAIRGILNPNGIYTVTVSDGPECIQTATVYIPSSTNAQPPYLNYDIVQPLTCNGDTAEVIINHYGTLFPNFNNYFQSYIDYNNKKYKFYQPGTYSFLVNTYNVCFAQIWRNIIIPSPINKNYIPTINVQNNLCGSNGTATINATIDSNYLNNVQFKWYNDSTNTLLDSGQNITINTSTKLRLAINDSTSCGFAKTFYVTNGTFYTTVSKDSICAGMYDTIKIMDLYPKIGATYKIFPNYNLDTNIGKIIIANPIVTTIYTIVNTANNTCTDTVFQTIYVKDTFTNNINLVYNAPLCGTNNLGSVSVISIPFMYTANYLWDNNATTNTIQNISSGKYAVLVTDTIGQCKYLKTIVPQATNCAAIYGKIMHDVNSNCLLDNTIDFYAGGSYQIRATSATNTYYTITDSLGNYIFINIPAGQYTITPLVNTTSASFCTNNVATYWGATSTPSQVNFLIRKSLYSNISILNNTTCLVPALNNAGLTSIVEIINPNYNLPNSVQVYCVLDSVGLFNYSIPAPNNIIGDTLFWNITNLISTASIAITFNLPNTILPSSIVNFTAGIYGLNNIIDSFTIDNHINKTFAICTAFDPNEKTENLNPNNYIASDNQYLRYNVKFQNTGNYPAINITVLDTLSNELNETSLQILNSSHKFKASIIKSNGYNILKMEFLGIMLLDSLHNEPLSHGSFTFLIKRKLPIVTGTTINNNVAIYFDNNIPVITNTVSHLTIDHLNLNTSYTNTSCINSTDGTINLTITNGIPPYTIKVNNVITTTLNIFNLPNGIYTINVKDAVGNYKQKIITLIPKSVKPSYTPVINNNTCYYSNNGAIHLNSFSTATNYQLLWSNGANGTIASNLVQGTYTLQAIDSLGCSYADTFKITTPDSIIATNTVVQNNTCFNALNSIVITNSNGGTGNLITYLNNNIINTDTLYNLPKGIYTITTKDAHNCTISNTFNVTSNDSLFLNINRLKNNNCFYTTDGQIAINATGGVGNISLNINNNIINMDTISNLAGGNYIITATDNVGCTISQSISIYKPDSITIIGSITKQNNCFYDAIGEVTFSANGGTGALTKLWNGSSTNSNIASNLAKGIYTLQVIDSLGCSYAATFKITTPDSIIVTNTVVQNNTCINDSLGKIKINAIGGTGFIIILLNSQVINSNIIEGLPNGIYSIVATDTKGCMVNNLLEIKSNPKLELEKITTINSAEVIVKGGVPPYTYNWLPTNNKTSKITNIPPGEYLVTVADKYNCNIVDTFNLNLDSITLTENLVLFPNPTSNLLYFKSNRFITNYQVLNSNGQIVLEKKNVNKYDGYIYTTTLPKGVYYFKIDREKPQKFMVSR